MLLLLHDNKFDDAYANQLIESKNQLSCQLESISVQDLLFNCTYTYDSNGMISQVIFGNKTYFVSEMLLVNRLIRLKAENFQIENVPAKTFFKYSTSFLSLLINSFNKATNLVGESCLSGSYHPLNMQWYLLKKHLKGIKTPEFDFSFGYKLNDLEFENPVTANPNDLAAPLIQTQEKIEPSMHTFRFSKQSGTAYVCYFSGEYFDVKCLSNEASNISDKDLHLLSQIKSFFGLFAGEILFFKNTSNQFVFGSINHYYDQASKLAFDTSIVTKGINDLVKQFRFLEAG